MSRDSKDRDVAVNRRAYHDYFVDEKYEAGVMLTGTEVKSVRNGRANLRDGYVRIDNGEAWLENVHISPYAQGNVMNQEPVRPRKLLLHRKEISSLIGKVNLGDGYVRVAEGEAWLENVYVAPYEHGGRENPEPVRRRKLLLHRGEIRELAVRLRNKGVTAVPLKLYLARGRAKVELGLARGKRQYDKREAIAERDAKREIARATRRG